MAVLCQKISCRNTYTALSLRRLHPEMTLQQIADLVGLTRERIRQILKANGLPTRRLQPNLFPCRICGKSLDRFRRWYQVSQPPTRRSIQVCFSCIRAVRDTCVAYCFICLKRVSFYSSAQIRRKVLKDRYFCSRKCLGEYLGKRYGFAARKFRAAVEAQKEVP